MGINKSLVTSVRVYRMGGHDVVRVWNRGALAGELTVNPGDGPFIARRLLEDLDSDDDTLIRVSLKEEYTLFEIDEERTSNDG